MSKKNFLCLAEVQRLAWAQLNLCSCSLQPPHTSRDAREQGIK